MFSIGNLSEKIGEKVSLELGFDKDKKDVVTYGIFAIFQIAASVVITAALGMIFGVCLESIIVSFTIAIYRKYAGGIHASTPNKCLVIGAVVCVIPIFIIKPYVEYWDSSSILVMMSLIFIFSYYIVYKYSPVDSKQKPIKKDSKKKRLKKGSIIILCIYLGVIIILALFYKFTLERNYLNYILSISIGVLWETFTLTKVAHYVFKK